MSNTTVIAPSHADSALAKFHFVLADRMKGPARAAADVTPESVGRFREQLERERERLADLPPSDIDLIIGGRDASRLRRYNAAKWTKESISLETCHVPDGMGRKSWMRGKTVPEAAAEFVSREGEKSRVWLMKGRVRLFLEPLPIIVLADAKENRIDDGSHRAVAAWLAGHREMVALVGRG
jgi:hypothetical protein